MHSHLKRLLKRLLPLRLQKDKNYSQLKPQLMKMVTLLSKLLEPSEMCQTLFMTQKFGRGLELALGNTISCFCKKASKT